MILIKYLKHTGNPLSKTYTYGKQTIDADDIAAVVEALKSDWLTVGPRVIKFETDLTNRFGAKAAVAVANGTAGLHLIGLALGWKPGDLILTTANTFLASANCALYCGADADFVDIDEVSYNICPKKLEVKLKSLKQAGKKVTAVIAVDFAGHPCDWSTLSKLSKEYGFDLIDDACHAMGAKFEGEEICSGKFVKAVNLSFHPVKTMTTGEGGAILSNDLEFIKKVKVLRTHGMTKDIDVMERNDGPWYYEMQTLGYNYRITDFQCALGSSQLAKLDRFNEKRRAIAKYYDENLDKSLMTLPKVASNVEHAYHLYPVLLNLEKFNVGKKEIFKALQDVGLNLQVHYYPVPLQPYYRKKYGFQESDFPVAYSFYQREISMPVYPLLENEDLVEICNRFHATLRKFLK
ncbi:MAG: UDP-4-amino-4,6-dideoxy-N-acetyl-beta-L-altrosamine transaminase [Bdellovibrio sp.]|nr:UDP-4-amino-4,6-dideoxy-N-acetyl-beta-L-altrosamine transaminase [Bdellovibrio sp.]